MLSPFVRRTATTVALATGLSLGAFAPLHSAAVAAPGSVATKSPSYPGSFNGKVKIAAVQTDTKLGEKAHNLADMQTRTRDAASNGADLVVFPELSLTGYKYRTIAEMAPDAETVPGPSTTEMAKTAAETGTYIAFGLVEVDNGKYYDTVVLVGPEGYVGKYAKITMGHHSEAVLFTRGPKNPPVFETSIGRIGLASCYDGAFPENARMMGVQGAQIMVLSNAENGSTWREYIRTRAFENNAYAVVANRVGTERNSTFNGDSIVAAPDYSILADASNTEVETVYGTADLSRASNDLVSERRPELYRALTRPQATAVLGFNAEPQSSVAGTQTGSDLLVSTTSVKPGTPISAELVTASGTVLASTTSTVGVDQARLRLTVPADAPVGGHTLKVSAAGSSKEIPFTVKDLPKPGPLGTMPGADASVASTAYIGFDTTLATDPAVEVTLSDGVETKTLTGRVNTGNIDNRVTVPYTGLKNNTTYTLTLPADSVNDSETGVGNDEFSFEFTTMSSATTSKTAIAQFDQVDGDVAANVEAMTTQLETAAASGTKLVTFGQLALTGDDLTTKQLRAAAEPLDGPSVQALTQTAADLEISLAFGMAETDAGKLYDTTVLIGPDGVIGSHRGTHLADDQVGIFTPGDTIAPVLETPMGPVGLFTSQELLFPEVIRSLAIRGALTVIGGVDASDLVWREIARSRGSENKVYVVVANQGESGGSLITRTSRGVDADLPTAEPGQKAFALNLTTIANRWYTYVDASTAKARTTHYYLDRRPEIYSSLSQRSTSKTTLSVSSPSATIGSDRVTATIAVAPGPDADTRGTVELRNGSTLLGSATLRNGKATIAVAASKLPAGRQMLTASYLGNDDLSLSSSERVALNIVRAMSTVTLKAPKKIAAGKSRKVTIAVTAKGVSAAGKVTVKVAGKTRTGSVVNGVATVKLPKLKAGKHTVKVSYAGSSKVTPATLTTKVKVRR